MTAKNSSVTIAEASTESRQYVTCATREWRGKCCGCIHLCMYGHQIYKSTDQPGTVANPARGQLNREKEYFPVPVRA